MRTSPARRLWADAGIALALSGLAWLLYRSVLQLWWMEDDFWHLRHLLTGRPGWYLFDASQFRQLSQVFTPLLFVSLDVDRRLFGIEPYSFYVHHLLVFSLCPAALFGVLRLWLPRLWAAAGAWLFLIGPVTASLAPLLPVRHYVEAILLTTLAVGAWAAALRRRGARSWAFACLSAVLYFAASLAKEIAVPLPALLVLLPDPTGSRKMDLLARFRMALPHGVALILYLILRHATLGTLMGGYGFAVTPSGLPGLALALPGKLAAELIGGRLSPASIILTISLIAGIVSLLLLRQLRSAGLTGLGLLLAMLPILLVSTRMEPRFAVPAWIVVTVAFVAGCRALAEGGSAARRRTAFVLAAAACLPGLALNRQDWNHRVSRAERMSAENRFLLDMREGNLLRHPLMLGASLGELQWMKANVFNRSPGGGWFQDDLHLCLRRGPLGRVWGYDPAARRVVDVTPRIPALRASHCSSIRPNVPLTASFHVSDGVLFWEFGPYPDGKYSFVLGDGTIVLEMPREAGFQLQESGDLPVRVKYESPAGWITYSPELRLELKEGWRSQWRRSQ